MSKYGFNHVFFESKATHFDGENVQKRKRKHIQVVYDDTDGKRDKWDSGIVSNCLEKSYEIIDSKKHMVQQSENEDEWTLSESQWAALENARSDDMLEQEKNAAQKDTEEDAMDNDEMLKMLQETEKAMTKHERPFFRKIIAGTLHHVHTKTDQYEIRIEFKEFKNDEISAWILREPFIDTPLGIGDECNVIVTDNADDSNIIDASQNYFIIHPNRLIRPTSITSAFPCARNAMINDCIGSSRMVWAACEGNILHELFGMALQTNFSTQTLQQHCRTLTNRNSEIVHRHRRTESELEALICATIPALQKFERTYMTGADAVRVERILAIEESINSFVFGICGKLDMTAIINGSVGPLELKTGRRYESHDGQLALYTLLLSEKYASSIHAGLLIYMNSTCDCNVLCLGADQLRSQLPYLLGRRNFLAHYMHTASLALKHTPSDESMLLTKAFAWLPEKLPLDQRFSCQRCFSRPLCTLLDVACTPSNSQNANDIVVHIDNTISRGSDSHLRYLRHWFSLLTWEDAFNNEPYWQRPPILAGMVLTAVERVSDGEEVLTFSTKYSHDLEEDNSVVLSIEDVHRPKFGVAFGTVQGIGPSLLHIFVRHCSTDYTTANYSWMLHRSSHTTITKSMKQNVISLVTSKFSSLGFESEGLAANPNLSNFIIDLEPPRFWELSQLTETIADSSKAALLSEMLCSQSNVFSKTPDNLVSEFRSLNQDQQHAVELVLLAKHYALLQGMPGTGKTRLIVFLVRVFAALGLSVCITSHTNSAVDSVCEGLITLNQKFVRVGNQSNVSEAVRPYVLDSIDDMSRGDGYYEFSHILNSALVVGVTCYSALKLGRSFDVVIVDEAGQILQPTCIGPLLLGKRFALIGDYAQLKPLVRSNVAARFGATESMLERLAKAHPLALARLCIQYRMNEQIAALSNAIIYNGYLTSGSKFRATERLALPRRVDVPWLSEQLQHHSVFWIDTCKLIHREDRFCNTMGGLVNVLETALVIFVAASLLRAGATSSQIGVISQYRSQVRFLSHASAKVGDHTLHHVLTQNTSTVDQYQGREKDIIILSLVRSNAMYAVGDLLNDLSRINVAVTRAKLLLIFVGDSQTLRHSHGLDACYKLLQERSAVYELSDMQLGLTYDIADSCSSIFERIVDIAPVDESMDPNSVQNKT